MKIYFVLAVTLLTLQGVIGQRGLIAKLKENRLNRKSSTKIVAQAAGESSPYEDATPSMIKLWWEELSSDEREFFGCILSCFLGVCHVFAIYLSSLIGEWVICVSASCTLILTSSCVVAW